MAADSLSLVPGEESGVLGRPSMSSDILIQRIETLPSRAVQDNYARKFLAYKDLVDVEYTAKDTLAVTFQVNGLSRDLARTGEVKTTFLKDGLPFREIERKAQQFPDLPDALEEVSLVDFPPAHYELRVRFLNAGAEIVTAGEAHRKSGDFGSAVAVLDKAISHYGVNASLLNGLGESYLGLGKRPEAMAAFEKSLQLFPDQPEVRRKLDDLKRRT